jgi:sigma-B regulation protein RsbU (phosphoserine phosphatase)
MTSEKTIRARPFWKGMRFLDWAALAVVFLDAVQLGLQRVYSKTPRGAFLLFLAICAVIYLTIRGAILAKEHLLWSLRNRLITTYLFIAVVPILLVAVMAGLAAYLLYWQLGSYVLYTEMRQRVDRVGTVTAFMVTTYAIEKSSGSSVAALALPVDQATYLKNQMTELPGLKVEMGTGEDLLRAGGSPLNDRFKGLVFSNGALSLRSVIARQTPQGRVLVSTTVPVTSELLETLTPELGPLQFDVLRPRGTQSGKAVSVVFNRPGYISIQHISTQQRSVPRAVNPFDKLITGIVSLDVLDEDQDHGPGQDAPTLLIASFATRPSLLNQRLFSPLGDLGGAAATALLVLGFVFLLIEIGSLVTGIVMTRTITAAVDDLYSATQHVQTGDLSYRVRVKSRDQLAALGESFNSMTHSVSLLIEEQGKRQKLENELSIAQEVQQQLFPHELPKMPGLELDAICRAARSVSGDYYDFIRISPTRLAIAIADISGKGISAALLMANVQAALRSDVLRYRDGQPGYTRERINTAEIVSHLNRHLFRNSSEDRYATMFLGVYDAETRKLSYTNGGHLPPLYICGEHVQPLETGGMVVGLFNDVPFEQGVVEIRPGGMLIAYSDGLIEPENALGEEFGTGRLIEVAMKNKHESTHVIAEALMQAAEQWAGSPEQADDMTVIVSRFCAPPQERDA